MIDLRIIFFLVMIANVADSEKVFYVDRGESVNVTCNFEMTLPSDFKYNLNLVWQRQNTKKRLEQKQGQKIEPSPARKLLAWNSLIFDNFREEDQGIYVCSGQLTVVSSALTGNVSYSAVKNTVNTIDTMSIYIKEDSGLTIDDFTAQVSILNSAQWMITAPEGTLPTDILLLTKNKDKMDSRRYKITKMNSTSLRLVLNDVYVGFLNDVYMYVEGIYFVTLKGTQGKMIQAYTLPPTIEVDQLTLGVTGTLTARCLVTNPDNLSPSLRKLFMSYDRCVNNVNAEDCKTHTLEKKYEFKDLSYPLRVEVERKAETTGKFYCEVQRPGYKETQASKQFVCVTDVLADSLPVENVLIEPILKILDNETIEINSENVTEGDTIVLTCRTSYCGEPYKVRHIEWYFQEDIPLHNLYSIGTSSATAQIVVKNISTREMDRYFCKSTPTLWKMLDLSKRSSDDSEQKGEVDQTTMTAIYATICVLLLAVLTFSFLYVRLKRRHLKQQNVKALQIFQQGNIEAIDMKLPISEQADLLPFGSEWYFPREKLKLGSTLGSGFFGVVMEAEADDILEGEEKTKVAVKTVKRHADPELLRALGKEVKILANLGSHPFIVNMLGAVVDRLAQGELLLIVEYCRFGCVLNYLKENRWRFTDKTSKKKKQEEEAIHSYQNTEPLPPFDSTVLMDWSYQIARGMEYLASRHVVHCDLAARNILLTADNTVKICDFGLAHDLYKKEEYIKQKGVALPLRWMAIESIEDRVFSTVTDVWSFGVVLWELFTIGKVPYMEFEIFQEVLEYIAQGNRLKKPLFATDFIYELMKSCWSENPKGRPTFTELTNHLLVELSIAQRNVYLKLEHEYQPVASRKKEVEPGYMPMTGDADKANQGIKARIGNMLRFIPNYYNILQTEPSQAVTNARYTKNPEGQSVAKQKLRLSVVEPQSSRETMNDFRLSIIAEERPETEINGAIVVNETAKSREMNTPTVEEQQTILNNGKPKNQNVSKQVNVSEDVQKDPKIGTPVEITFSAKPFEVPLSDSQIEEYIILPSLDQKATPEGYVEMSPLPAVPAPEEFAKTTAQNAKVPEGYLVMNPVPIKAKEAEGYVDMHPLPKEGPTQESVPKSKFKPRMALPEKSEKILPPTAATSREALPWKPKVPSQIQQKPLTVIGIVNNSYASLPSQSLEGDYDFVPPTLSAGHDQDDLPPPLPSKSEKIAQVGSMLINARKIGKDHYERPREIVVHEETDESSGGTNEGY